jgi:hypothetical protein
VGDRSGPWLASVPLQGSEEFVSLSHKFKDGILSSELWARLCWELGKQH